MCQSQAPGAEQSEPDHQGGKGYGCLLGWSDCAGQVRGDTAVLQKGVSCSRAWGSLQEEDELEEGVETSPVASRRGTSQSLGPGKVV